MHADLKPEARRRRLHFQEVEVPSPNVVSRWRDCGRPGVTPEQYIDLEYPINGRDAAQREVIRGKISLIWGRCGRQLTTFVCRRLHGVFMLGLAIQSYAKIIPASPPL